MHIHTFLHMYIYVDTHTLTDIHTYIHTQSYIRRDIRQQHAPTNTCIDACRVHEYRCMATVFREAFVLKSLVGTDPFRPLLLLEVSMSAQIFSGTGHPARSPVLLQLWIHEVRGGEDNQVLI